MRLPILQLSCRLFFRQNITSPRSVSPPNSPDLVPCDIWLFPKLKPPLKVRIFVNATGTQYTSSVKRRLTADWLAPRESDCSRMRSKVSSDWLQSYIKATRPVLEIFKTAGYFPDSPCTHDFQRAVRHSNTRNLNIVPVSRIALRVF